MSSAGPARLQSLRDGVLAPFPLVPSVGFAYLGLLIGIVPTALLSISTAWGTRSVRGAVGSLVIAIVGFALPIPVILIATLAGDAVPFALWFLLIRVGAVALGFALMKLHYPDERAHLLLGGRSLDLMHAIVAAFFLVLLSGSTLRLAMEAPVLLLLTGGG